MRKTLVLVTLCSLALTSCGGEPKDGGGGQQAGSATTPAATFAPGPSESPTPIASPSPVAPPGPEWRRAISFSARAITTDAEGDVYITGSQELGPDQPWGRTQAMVLERTDANGERVWIRRWTSSGQPYRNATGTDVAVSPDGSLVYVAGEVFDEAGENRRVRVWAFSLGGDLRWTHEAPAVAFGSAVAATDERVVVGGYGWLGAWDPQGAELWSRGFEEPAGEHCDEVADLAIDDEGDIYVVGLLDLTPTCNDMEGLVLEDADIVIQKRSASGDLRWSRVFEDAGVDIDRALGVDVAGRGVFVTGEEDGRAWLARISPNGRVRWTDLWGKAGSGMFGIDVSVAPTGAVYVIGGGPPHEDPATVYLRRYNTSGALEWTWRRRLPGEAEAVDLGTAAGDGALYVLTSDFPERSHIWRLPA